MSLVAKTTKFKTMENNKSDLSTRAKAYKAGNTAGTETFQKRCFNFSFYVVRTFLERHFWKVYVTLEAKR